MGESSLETFTIAGSFNPCTMAFWARVPASSAAEVINVDSFKTFRCLWDIVPFVCFGPQQIGVDGNGESAIMPPSYIACNVNGEPTLEVNLICGSGHDNGFGSSTDPDYYGNSQLHSTYESPGFPSLPVDMWHHIMVSWQINPQSNSGYNPMVAGTSLMYCFIDGESKTGFQLPAMQGGDLSGTNGHMSHTINFSGRFEEAAASSSAGSINGSPLVFPVSPNAQVGSTTPAVKSAFHVVQMGEFYLYCGQMLTSAAAFIDKGKPAKRKKVFEALGEADICMSGSSSWIKGKPKGSQGRSVEFTSTGEIKRYKPDPSIGG